MNARMPFPDNAPQTRWDHLDAPRKADLHPNEDLNLVESNENGEPVFLLMDANRSKVHLVIKGTPPESDRLAHARALENQLLEERNTRLPVY